MIGMKINEFIRGLVGGVIAVPLMVLESMLDIITGTCDNNVEDNGLLIGIVLFLGFLFWL